ncbi:MAG: DUF1465 family protein [Candidatus Pacebacteria bacterium]|nr:DUF1465 family protein [Candidatus Paceibacterota bacterium]
MLFITPSYDEAFKLLVESRNYIAEHNGTAVWRQGYDADQQRGLIYSCETSRLTTRLLEIMAWLMIQRAVQEGEITMVEANQDRNRLLLNDTCLKNPIELPELPEGLMNLSLRSYQLYLRLARLDGLLAARLEEGEEPSDQGPILSEEEQLNHSNIDYSSISKIH